MTVEIDDVKIGVILENETGKWLVEIFDIDERDSGFVDLEQLREALVFLEKMAKEE